MKVEDSLDLNEECDGRGPSITLPFVDIPRLFTTS